MKQTTKMWIGMTILAFASSAVTGAVVKKTTTNEAPTPIFAPSPVAAAAPGGLVDLTAAAESSVNAVVYIKVTQTGKTQRVTVQDPFSDFFGDFFGFGGRGQQPQQREYKAPDRHGAGSGVIISSDGYIVTNFHVVDGAKSIVVERVIDSNHEQFAAAVVTVDKNNDLAIIKIDPSNNKVKWSIPYNIKLTSSKVGESCFALGFPMTSTMGDEIKLTNGIISSLSGFQGDVSTYQISVPIQPGNSGGPLFNQKGEIIGIVNAKHKGAENVSYAIKTSYLNNLVESFASSKLFPSNNQVSTKSLPDQVAMIKPYVFYIKCEQ